MSVRARNGNTSLAPTLGGMLMMVTMPPVSQSAKATDDPTSISGAIPCRPCIRLLSRTIGPRIDALSGSLAVLELAFVSLTIGKSQDSLAVKLIVPELALVSRTIRENQ
jgi:hypothetical protein